MVFASATVVGHTTASSPRPHILYTVQVKTTDGKTSSISKRYSDVSTLQLVVLRHRLTASRAQFVALHDTLNDPGSLPPKRILSTTFVPSAWLDDTLIAERKAGLSAYLTGLVQSPQFRAHQFFADFLAPSAPPSKHFSMEDAIPSTLSRKAALAAQGEIAAEATPIAAAYYPDWSSDSNPPSSLDFSKFDILLFGTSARSRFPDAVCVLSPVRGASAAVALGSPLCRLCVRPCTERSCLVPPPRASVRSKAGSGIHMFCLPKRALTAGGVPASRSCGRVSEGCPRDDSMTGIAAAALNLRPKSTARPTLTFIFGVGSAYTLF